jgi:hypothetical protein
MIILIFYLYRKLRLAFKSKNRTVFGLFESFGRGDVENMESVENVIDVERDPPMFTNGNTIKHK